MSRLDLHERLCTLIGSRNVYFQPPETLEMLFPCLIYSTNDLDTKWAGNRPYGIRKAYSIVYVDPDPDSDVPDRLAELPLCRFNRFYTSDNLNHWAFTLYDSEGGFTNGRD